MRLLLQASAGLALLIASASCSRSTDATGSSPPSGSAQAAPTSTAASSATPAADTAEDRKRAAILWLRYAERTIPMKAPERWGDLSLTCAELGYPRRLALELRAGREARSPPPRRANSGIASSAAAALPTRASSCK